MNIFLSFTLLDLRSSPHQCNDNDFPLLSAILHVSKHWFITLVSCLFIFLPHFLLFSFHFLIPSLLHYFYLTLLPFFLLLFFCYSIQCFLLLSFNSLSHWSISFIHCPIDFALYRLLRFLTSLMHVRRSPSFITFSY